jgi:hypothetical protein
LWEILQSDACFTGYGVIFFCYSGALELFAELLQRFPNNVHLLTETAKVEAIIGKNDEAIMRFEKVVTTWIFFSQFSTSLIHA